MLHKTYVQGSNCFIMYIFKCFNPYLNLGLSQASFVRPLFQLVRMVALSGSHCVLMASQKSWSVMPAHTLGVHDYDLTPSTIPFLEWPKHMYLIICTTTCLQMITEMGLIFPTNPNDKLMHKC